MNSCGLHPLRRSEFRHLVVFRQPETGEDACMTEHSVSLQDEDGPGKSLSTELIYARKR